MLTTYLLWMTVPVIGLWLAATVMHIGSVDTRRGGGTGVAWLDTRSTFDSARWRHDLWSLRMSLIGRRQHLSLPVLRQPYGLRGMRPIGEQSVALAEIVGSVDGRHHPFDRRFDPTSDAAWRRYSAVFAARTGSAGVPPVTLYRAADGYYVLDGHHRVAVARAFGDKTIRADVTLVCD